MRTQRNSCALERIIMAAIHLVVGCGLSGATVARKVSEELGEKVVINDSRPHIAGNCYDFRDDNDLVIQRYGAHLFHTNVRDVWDFLSRVTRWLPYFHRVGVVVDGMEVPLPFNLTSLRMVFPPGLAERLEAKLLERFSFNSRLPILELRKDADSDIRFIAEYIYGKVFLPYTQKQWGWNPEEIDPSITARVPVLIGKDDRYFSDRFQAIPVNGYTAMVEKMLDHPLIEVRLNTPYDAIRDAEAYDRVFYTGSVDEFFFYEHGMLPYRSVRFDYMTYPKKRMQRYGVVNYP